jgi:hypothetical protein
VHETDAVDGVGTEVATFGVVVTHHLAQTVELGGGRVDVVELEVGVDLEARQVLLAGHDRRAQLGGPSTSEPECIRGADAVIAVPTT